MALDCTVLQGKVAALFVRDELLVDKVAVFISPGSYYSQNLATEFIRMFSSLNGEITEQIVLSEENQDISEIMISLKKKDPEPLVHNTEIGVVMECETTVGKWKPFSMRL